VKGSRRACVVDRLVTVRRKIPCTIRWLGRKAACRMKSNRTYIYTVYCERWKRPVTIHRFPGLLMTGTLVGFLDLPVPNLIRRADTIDVQMSI